MKIRKMKIHVTTVLLLFSCFFSHCMNFENDSTKVQFGLSANIFTKSEIPFSIELKLKNASNNIFGIGTGYTIYYFRQIPKLQKNIIVGVPVILNRHDVSKTEASPVVVLHNFIQVAPSIGLQFEMGKKQFLRLRATYSPIVFDWKRDKNKSIVDNHYLNQFGFGLTINPNY